MQLNDKAIIVTGSTTGIGEAIARRCVAEGAHVLIHGRDRERAEQVRDSLGQSAACHVDDLTDPEAPQRLVQTALDWFGRIDGLVNNAAWVVRDNLHDTSVETFDRAMATNVRAPMLLIRAALPSLKERQGSVVNIGSVNAYTGEPRQMTYSMSKGALMTLSRNLANALGPDRVRINHFNVGWVLTPNEYQLKIREGLPENWPETLSTSDLPTGTMTTPEQIAAHAAFWLSDDSRPITGTVLELEQHPVIGRIPLKEGS